MEGTILDSIEKNSEIVSLVKDGANSFTPAEIMKGPLIFVHTFSFIILCNEQIEGYALGAPDAFWGCINRVYVSLLSSKPCVGGQKIQVHSY